MILVHEHISCAAELARNWLTSEFPKNARGWYNGYPRNLGYVRGFPSQVHRAIYENFKIPAGPILPEAYLDTGIIPVFEGKLDYGFRLIDNEERGKCCLQHSKRLDLLTHWKIITPKMRLRLYLFRVQ